MRLAFLTFAFCFAAGCGTDPAPPDPRAPISCPETCTAATATLCALPSAGCVDSCNACLCQQMGGEVVSACEASATDGAALR